MKKVLSAAAAVFLFAGAAPAAAQVALEANAAKSEGQWGAELGAGYSVLAIDNFRITPGVGLFIYDREDERFVLDRTGADPVCRNVSTAQPVDEDRCDGTGTKIYGRVEATYTVPLAGLTLGTGARLIGDNLRPYGTVAVPLLPVLQLKGNIGPKYYAAGVSARF